MDLENYAVTVQFSDGRWRWHEICTCGYCKINEQKLHGYKEVLKCPSCGNENYKELPHAPKEKMTRVLDGIFETIDKKDNYFNIIKTDIKVCVTRSKAEEDEEDGFSIELSLGHKYEIKYDLAKSEINITKNGNKIISSETNLDVIFRKISIDKLLEYIGTENNTNLYQTAYLKLACEGYERSSKISRMLSRLFSYPSLQIFAFSGYKFINSIYEERQWRISKETTPHAILGIPKSFIRYLKDETHITENKIEALIKLSNFIDNNSLISIFDLLIEESSFSTIFNIHDTFIELCENYGYKTNVKTLILYLVRTLKIQQGITSPQIGATTLRDYCRMSKAMGSEYEKYSKSLKKDHDIAQMNYKANEDVYKRKQFEEVVSENNYKDLTFKSRKNKKYIITIPTKSDDLITEGSILNHCVSSYIDDVIDKKCKVIFLREKENPDKSFITIDLRFDGKNEKVRQVEGYNRRKPNEEEMLFIREWAEKKELHVSLH